MKGLRLWQKAALAALACAIVCGACWAVSAVKENVARSKDSLVEVPPAGEADGVDDAPADKAVLTAEQKALIAGYGTGEKALADALRSTRWVDQQTGASVAFEGDAWRVVDDGGKSAAGTFAVEAAEDAGEYTESGATVSRTSFRLLLGDDEAEGTLMEAEGGDAGVDAMLLIDIAGRDLACYGDAGTDEMPVEGLDEAALKDLGCTQDELDACVRGWAQKNMPSAAGALWTGEVSKGYGGASSSTTFALVGPATSHDVVVTVAGGKAAAEARD